MKHLITFLFFLFNLLGFCQSPIYNGGINDGFSISCYEQGVTPTYGIYTGGTDSYTSDFCYAQNQTISYLYLGGTESVTYLNCYSQTQTETIFFGGINDGNDMSCYTQTSFIPSFFKGGIDNGFDVSCYTQNLSPQAGMYYGGISASPIISCYMQLTTDAQNMFYGGSDNSIYLDCYLQNVINTIYNGGISSNNKLISCYEQLDYLLTPLPIELVSFQVECHEDQVAINWQTASELNSDYFSIEKSMDLTEWHSVGKVTSAGNSTSLIEYMFTDPSPSRGISYYRLKQVDFDGEVDYSPVRSSNCESPVKTAEVLTYPNPVSELLNVQFSNFSTDNIYIQMYNSNSQLIYENNILLEEGEGTFEIQRPHNMPSGSYFIILHGQEDERITKKLIFQ